MIASLDLVMPLAQHILPVRILPVRPRMGNWRSVRGTLLVALLVVLIASLAQPLGAQLAAQGEEVAQQQTAGRVGLTDITQLDTWAELGRLMFNMLFAALLAAVIAFHPQRLAGRGEIDWEMKKSQILIALTGAIMVLIIGNSLARAFGLVGLGSFIRFRTSVRNPLEIAIIFVLIVIGMACGLDRHLFAIVCTAFIFILIFVLNLHEPEYTQVWEVKTQGGRPEQCRAGFEQLAGDRQFHIERLNLNLTRQLFSCRFRPPRTVDLSDVDRQFEAKLADAEAKPEAVQWNRVE